MKIELEIKDEIIAAVLDGAGSRYWCSNLDWSSENIFAGSCWAALLAGRISHVIVNEDRSEQRRKPLAHVVGRNVIGMAVQVIAEKYPHHLGAVLGGYENGNADQNTGDLLLQCMVFGREKYC